MIAQEQADLFETILEHLGQFAPGDTQPGEAPIPYPAYGAPDQHPVEPVGFLDDTAIPDVGGEGEPGACVIGIIDDSIPFAHQQLCLEGKHARVASVWVQDAQGLPAGMGPDAPGRDLPFGREFRGSEISALLERHHLGGSADETALYAELGLLNHLRDSRQSFADAYTHGAAVAGLAAGFEASEATARQFPVVAVSLPDAVTRDTLGTFMPYYIFVATLHILHRTKRLCRWIEHERGLAANSVRLPVVINLSYGLTAGPKDGSDFMSRFQDALTRTVAPDIGPVRFVVPMGNHRQSRCHARLQPGAEVDWHVAPDDKTPSFVEFWAASASEQAAMQLEVCPPFGSSWISTSFSGFGQWSDLKVSGRHLARAYLQRQPDPCEPDVWRQVITLAIPPTVPTSDSAHYGPPGVWRLRLCGAGEVFAFVQRDDTLRGRAGSGGRQAFFDAPGYQVYDAAGRLIEEDDGTGIVTRLGSVNAFACGTHQVRVGGVLGNGKRAPYAGIGFGADDQHGDRHALSDRSVSRRGLIVPGQFGGSRQVVTGTSVAAPQITRALAFELAGLQAPPEKPPLADY